MPRLVIALPPRLIIQLRKAFSRGPTVGHKYVRRERAFVGGRMTWRYYYRDEKQRTEHALSIDPQRRHEHRTLAEVEKIHPHLKAKLLAAVDATLAAIRRLFGAAPPKLDSTPGWIQKVHAPSVAAEAADPDSAGRSPQARVQRALELIPDHLRTLVAGKTDHYQGLRDVLLTTRSEDPVSQSMPLSVIAGWADKQGNLRITDAAATTPTGRAYFGSPQTLTEEVVAHEFGHHVHFALEDVSPDIIKSWQALLGPRISNYAHTNWKEDWAETFACVITHPRELADKCPERYDFMRAHVMPELPERYDFMRTPDEELAWWNPRPQTPASRALAQMRRDTPARRFYPYYSERDQFYVVSRGGRTVYLRFGPPDKNAEAGWERMPATIDPETSLPRYEGQVYTRFNGYGALKEIYDENRRPLDSRQAWLYLGQDDEKVIAQVTKIAGDDPRGYGSLVADKGAEDISHLGRKMFDALGGNLPDATLDKERARVAKARARGEGGVLERHEWTPVEISETEFVQKSGTFKFGGVREAAEQPHVVYDIVGGKQVTRTYFDAAEQKNKPVLAVRLYEQVNPDGTMTRVRVHEDASFSAGETILAPARVTRVVDGAERPVVEWRRRELGPSDSTDPSELARQLGTTARELLERNQRYGRGQIMDPVMSALLNPGGRRQVRSAQDLQELMRVAAESDPPRRAWVSIVGGSSNVAEQAVSHIEVEWDGAGPPLVVGDYWARKLGKDRVRIDELLDSRDKIRLERIREQAPRQLPVQLGATVLVTDPKTGRRIAGKVVGRKAVEGEEEKRWSVQPLAGQGAGVGRDVLHLQRNKLRPTTEADVPGQPGISRRQVLPLEHDVLLYADDVPRGSGPGDPGGVIRVLMPTDGSVTWEQLKRLPGVQPPREGLLHPQISVEDVPRFRAALGGFVMDGRVRAMLERQVQLERQRAEQREAEPVVAVDQIVDDDGNIAPGGVLRGLVTGSEGIQPGSHRIKALQKLAQSGGRLIAAHFMGCLSGDATIDVDRGEGPEQVSICDLVAWMGSEGRSLAGPLGLSLDVEHSRLARNRVVEALDSGMRRTFELRTEAGRAIRATTSHPFYVATRRDGVRRVEKRRLDNIWRGEDVLVAVDGELTEERVSSIDTTFRMEQTYDLIMLEPHRNYVANGFVVSNTGKTAFAIMAAQMMRNLTDKEGNPHPSQTKKKTIVIVPLNTAENWYQEYKKFAGEAPTLLGASTLAGAQQLPKLEARKPSESDNAYRVRAVAEWREQCREKPNLWNPFSDPSRNVVIGSEYFRDHEEALRLADVFDGMVVDEAHEIARENETSRAVERWNPQMRMWLGLTGTPIMNTLDVVPRLVRLVTAGRTDLGTEEQFTKRFLMPSAVLRQHGALNPPSIDVNPMRAGELAAVLQPLMDVATTADVKGQAMPAVLLDENEPAHMLGQQARMYRAAMARLTEAEREALALSSSLGLDERQLLTDEARARVDVARSLANNPAYKAPDAREDLLYRTQVPVANKRGEVKLVTQDRPFRLPDHKTITSREPGGWRGRWPSAADVLAGRIDEGYFGALSAYGDRLFGTAYEYLAGTPIAPEQLEAIKKGAYVTPTGHEWGGRVPNPDYGPEGAVARGRLDPETGQVVPLTYRYRDEHGAEVERLIPTGTRFVRDPNKKAAGLFYHEDDWDHTGRFEDSGESSPGTEGAPAEEEAEPAKKRARGQGPKPGREAMSVQRSPARREQRAMFDAVMTSGNAKCDKLEHWMRNVLSGKTGDPNPESAQFIVFGNRIGSSVRTVESKLRTMGYQDVNEALGPAEYSSEEDKSRTPRKFFVSYMGKGATLGDRNLNSEIFRRVQDQFGKDVGSSVFVWRTLYGSSGKALRLGETREGWGRTERRTIAESFVDNGAPLEVPMRVRGADDGGSVVPEYAYESDLRPAERAEVRDIEVRLRSSSGREREALEARLAAVLEPHYVRRTPLSPRATHVLNNCQVMVASDAANVGLNWPAGYLGMYDSLFSPMGEWQRITRAARMLPPAVSRGMRPIVDKLDKLIHDWEHGKLESGEARFGPELSTGDKRVDYDPETAMSVVQRAIEQLPAEDRAALAGMEGGRAEQLVEAYFARRALDRIAGLREGAEQKLRTEGYYPDPNKPQVEENWVAPVAVTEVDVNNYIVRELLTPFEKKMMRARRYLVDVQRFTTSVDMPVFEAKMVTDPETGKKKRIRVPVVGRDQQPIMTVESPSQAEKSQLVQQRAKQKPYEFFMKTVQNAQPQETRYDFVAANQRSLAQTSLLAGVPEHAPVDYLADEGVHYAAELAKPELSVRLSVPAVESQEDYERRASALAARVGLRTAQERVGTKPGGGVVRALEFNVRMAVADLKAALGAKPEQARVDGFVEAVARAVASGSSSSAESVAADIRERAASRKTAAATLPIRQVDAALGEMLALYRDSRQGELHGLQLLADAFAKKSLLFAKSGGPFIGPRGGKWRDAQHTVSWVEHEDRARALGAARLKKKWSVGKKLGHGGYATVFHAGEGHVVKVTQSRTDGDALMAVANARLQGQELPPGLPRVKSYRVLEAAGAGHVAAQVEKLRDGAHRTDEENAAVRIACDYQSDERVPDAERMRDLVRRHYAGEVRGLDAGAVADKAREYAADLARARRWIQERVPRAASDASEDNIGLASRDGRTVAVWMDLGVSEHGQDDFRKSFLIRGGRANKALYVARPGNEGQTSAPEKPSGREPGEALRPLPRIRFFVKAYRDRIPGGLADKKRPGDFDARQLERGIRVEMEHTSDRRIAREIAMDHLTEDPRYYEKLARMEAKRVIR